MDTIFALATAPGRAGVAVVRVSGPRAWEICRVFAGVVPEPRRASLRRLVYSGNVIDEALVLTFPAGESFTGENVVEFQTHGSPAVIRCLLNALSEQDGARVAEAGEFTRRALENGRLDLAEVEGLSDLLSAETEAQRRQAFRVFDGELGRQVETWRSKLIRAAALVESTIDFADEEVPEDVSPEVEELLRSLLSEFNNEINGIYVAERLRSGFEVAIVGPPNAGKSTLLNRLAGRDAAITSEIAGTTRDVIEVRMDLEGIPVTFLDTAGLRETDDRIESIGVQRALERATLADIRVVLGSATDGLKIEPEDLVVTPKSDLLAERNGFSISGATGEGVAELLEYLAGVLEKRVSQTHLATNIRHQQALQSAAKSLDHAIEYLLMDSSLDELVAEAIRAAIRGVDSLVGRIGVEDVLGEVFSNFCIGK